MKPENIKPIPKYILKKIKKADKERHPTPIGILRFYSYFTKNSGELVKMTVAVKHRYKKWYCKQVAIHGLHSDKCWVKDMAFHYIAGYKVGWYYEGISKYKDWYESPEWGYADDKMFDPYAPIVNPEYITKFPEFKYSAYELYKGVDLLKYLRVYEKHPGVEMLVKLGLQDFAHRKTIINKCEKDKLFRKWLFKHAKDIRHRYYYVSSIIMAYNKKITLDEAQRIESIRKSLMNKDYKEIRAAIQRDYIGFDDYIKGQKISYYQYRDYAAACNYIGLDMSLKKNRFPHDFKTWHDIRIDEYAKERQKMKEKEQKAFIKQFKSVAMKYLPLERAKDEDYIIIIAKTPNQLVKEGSTLHHCVGRMNYDSKMAREETLIFFIRYKDKPNKPLATMEYSPKQKQILQCYGDHDSPPEKALSYFVRKKWLPYANRKLKKLVA